MACGLSIRSKALALAGSGRTGLAIASGRLHGAGGHGQERRIVMARTVAGETKIDTADALDVFYLGFFQETGGAGSKGDGEVKGEALQNGN